MNQLQKPPYIRKLCYEIPAAIAQIRGNRAHEDLKGIAAFYKVDNAVLVSIWVQNLPDLDHCSTSIFACHIHAGNSCQESNGMFTRAGSHLNLDDCPHPYHTGDLPPLFALSNNSAFLSTVTSRFTIADIVNRVLIIHEQPDDFTTQPSGNSGTMIACGKIQLLRIKEKNKNQSETTDTSKISSQNKSISQHLKIQL